MLPPAWVLLNFIWLLNVPLQRFGGRGFGPSFSAWLLTMSLVLPKRFDQ